MEWEDKRILITGAMGIVGKELVKRLVPLGAKVLSVDVVSGDEIGSPVEHIQTDLSKDISMSMLDFEPEVVFHLAATFERTEEMPDFWDSNFDNNVLLSHKLLRHLKSCPSIQVFVFASSYLIYNPKWYLDISKVCYLKESDSIAPRNLVGLAKYFTERELDFLQETGSQFRAVSARIFRVYGCGSRDVISRWIRSALQGEPIKVYGRENHFDYVYAGDVAEGLIKLTESESDAAKGVVNLGSGIARSINDVVDILRAELENLQVEDLQYNDSIEFSCADMTLFRQLTGWMPQTSLKQGIHQVIVYEKQRQALKR